MRGARDADAARDARDGSEGWKDDGDDVARASRDDDGDEATRGDDARRARGRGGGDHGREHRTRVRDGEGGGAEDWRDAPRQPPLRLRREALRVRRAARPLSHHAHARPVRDRDEDTAFDTTKTIVDATYVPDHFTGFMTCLTPSHNSTTLPALSTSVVALEVSLNARDYYTDPNPSDASLSAADYYSSSGVSFNARVEPTISSISRTACEVVRSTIDGR